MTTKKLQTFFEENGFNVNLFEQDKIQCAELEKWTNGGVDMIIYLEPFTIDEFKSYVDDFNVDDEIDLHRQSQEYKNTFTIRESLVDFEDFYNDLKELTNKL